MYLYGIDLLFYWSTRKGRKYFCLPLYGVARVAYRRRRASQPSFSFPFSFSWHVIEAKGETLQNCNESKQNYSLLPAAGECGAGWGRMGWKNKKRMAGQNSWRRARNAQRNQPCTQHWKCTAATDGAFLSLFSFYFSPSFSLSLVYSLSHSIWLHQPMLSTWFVRVFVDKDTSVTFVHSAPAPLYSRTLYF